jgi:hypothetical protein
VTIDIGEVLTRAWQITWKHKVLWVISMLPLLITFLFLPIWLAFVFSDNFDPDRIEAWVENPIVIIVGSLLYILLIGGGVVLQVLSRSAVTLGIYRVEAESQAISFMGLLRDGFQYFWRILGTILLIGLGLAAFFLIFFACAAVLAAVTMGIAMLCIQPLFLLMAPAIWLVMALMEQAEAAVIADGMNVTDAIQRGYQLIRSNFGSYVLLTLVLYFGLGILTSLIFVPFMIPMFLFMMRNMEAGAPDFNNIMRMQAIFGVVILPVITLVQSFVLTYMKSALTVTYLRLTRSPSESQPALQAASA